jgi:hypothetical protein
MPDLLNKPVVILSEAKNLSPPYPSRSFCISGILPEIYPFHLPLLFDDPPLLILNTPYAHSFGFVSGETPETQKNTKDN